MNHGANLIGQVLHLQHVLAGPLLGRQADRHARDLGGLVADPLQIGDGLDHGVDQSKVTGGRLAAHQDLAAILVDPHLDAVDRLIGGLHLRCEYAVQRHQRTCGVENLRFDTPAHFQHTRADVFQFGVELAGDVLPVVRLVHCLPSVQPAGVEPRQHGPETRKGAARRGNRTAQNRKARTQKASCARATTELGSSSTSAPASALPML